MWLTILQLCLLPSSQAASDDPTYNRLRPEHARAASYLQSDWNKFTENYHPYYVLDDDPKTAWVEGEPGNGEGSSLFLDVSRLRSARAVKLRLRNGYQKSARLLQANSAPKDVVVRLHDSDGEVAIHRVRLAREMGWQEVVTPVPEGSGLSSVQLTYESVHPGTRYEDTCISDIQVLVDSDVAYSSGQEAANHAYVMDFVGSHTQRARFFASPPEGYPFRTAWFASTSESLPEAGFEAAIGDLRARMSKAFAGRTPHRLQAGTALQLPEGAPGYLHELELAPFLLPSNLRFVPTEVLVDKRGREGGDDFRVEHNRSAYRVEPAPGAPESGPPRWVAFWDERVTEGRSLWRQRAKVLLGFDAKGRIEVIYVNEDTSEPIAAVEEMVIRFPRDAEGRVSRIEEWRHRRVDAQHEEGDYEGDVLSYTRRDARERSQY